MRGIDIHHPPLFWWPAWDLLTAYWPPTVTSTGLWTICHPGWSLFFVGWVEGFPHSTDPQETCGVRTSRNDACDCPKNRLSPFHLLLKKIMFTIELPHFGVPVYQNFQTYPISIRFSAQILLLDGKTSIFDGSMIIYHEFDGWIVP